MTGYLLKRLPPFLPPPSVGQFLVFRLILPCTTSVPPDNTAIPTSTTVGILTGVIALLILIIVVFIIFTCANKIYKWTARQNETGTDDHYYDYVSGNGTENGQANRGMEMNVNEAYKAHDLIANRSTKVSGAVELNTNEAYGILGTEVNGPINEMEVNS